ncbi:efflux RND transporter periplasmic adaptor subunit [Planctomycetes bacterium K23_9]|uniref:CusB-like beta-barrel domain-containing protein n=1 Tax=Stieleria marina TaxID=1930275 RepID=A0A517NX62_9BACT|nr:hypothetical protein K239x_36760 [Planctomycetes bacterium K23_9]
MTTGASPTDDSGANIKAAGLNVSLLGSSHRESAEAARHVDPTNATPESLAAFIVDEQRKTSKNRPMVPRADVDRIMKLIETVSTAKDRAEAISLMVNQIAADLEGSTVRCGLGGKQLRRLYDQKLGWLGPESTLFVAAQERWSTRVSGLSKATNEQERDTFTVSIPQPDGEGHCSVWITGFDRTPFWLQATAATLRYVVWDRPTKSWLRAPERLRLASSAWLVAAGMVFAVIALWPIDYRIPCTAIVQPVQQRLVAAPFEATLLETKIQPGDVVQAGQLLVLLDGRPLRLELESIETEIQRFDKEHRVALVNGRVAESQQAALSKRRSERRHQLLSDRLERLEVTSPIDGVVVSGDLERFIGSPLETGQTILEVAPLDRVLVEIEIPEFEIGYVQAESDTRVRFASVGGASIRQKIQAVYPAAEVRDDRSVFVAKIEVDNSDGKLRPGMKGDATTYGPLRPTSWSWIRGTWERMLWWAGY